MSTEVIDKPKLTLLQEDDWKKQNGMTQAEYADHRQITRQAVYKHKMAGNLVLYRSGRVDVEASDTLLDSILDPSFTGNAEEQKGNKKGNGHEEAIPETLSGIKLDLMKLKRDNEKRERDTKDGLLVNKRGLEKAFGSKISAVVTRLQKIPKRLAPSLAKQTNMGECEEMIKTEIKDAVEEFN